MNGIIPFIIPESQVRWFLNEILKENLIGFSRFMLRTPYFFSGLEPSPCHTCHNASSTASSIEDDMIFTTNLS